MLPAVSRSCFPWRPVPGSAGASTRHCGCSASASAGVPSPAFRDTPYIRPCRLVGRVPAANSPGKRGSGHRPLWFCQRKSLRRLPAEASLISDRTFASARSGEGRRVTPFPFMRLLAAGTRPTSLHGCIHGVSHKRERSHPSAPESKAHPPPIATTSSQYPSPQPVGTPGCRCQVTN